MSSFLTASIALLPFRNARRPARPVGGVAAGVVAALTLAGCVPGISPADVTGVTYRYVATAGPGTMNQLLYIVNGNSRAVAPTVHITALDSVGKLLPDVAVGTVFGSTEGRLVVPPGEGVDVLTFEGVGADRVADVRVDTKVAETVNFPAATSEVLAQPLDKAGTPVTRNDRIASVKLTNNNPAKVTVRLVYIVWTEPPPGRTQQVNMVVPVGGLITVPGAASVTVPMDGEAAQTNERTAGRVPASVKVYFSREAQPPATLPMQVVGQTGNAPMVVPYSRTSCWRRPGRC